MHSQVYLSARNVPTLGFFELTVDEARELMDYICSDEMAVTMAPMETDLRYTVYVSSFTERMVKELSVIVRFEVGEGYDEVEADKEYLESIRRRIDSHFSLRSEPLT